MSFLKKLPCLAVAVTALGFATIGEAKPIVLNSIRAVVNGEPITQSMVDAAVQTLAVRLAGYSPEAMCELKRAFWQGTEHWDELLAQRAATSGRLVLSDFTKEALKKFR